jgi:hypothetical protein
MEELEAGAGEAPVCAVRRGKKSGIFSSERSSAESLVSWGKDSTFKGD